MANMMSTVEKSILVSSVSTCVCVHVYVCVCVCERKRERERENCNVILTITDPVIQFLRKLTLFPHWQRYITSIDTILPKHLATHFPLQVNFILRNSKTQPKYTKTIATIVHIKYLSFYRGTLPPEAACTWLHDQWWTQECTVLIEHCVG